MTDPSDLVTPRRRRGLFAVLALYVLLLVVEVATNSPYAGAAADLTIAAFAVGSSGYLLSQFWTQGSGDRVVVAATASLFVAGVAIGYEGLSRIDLVPASVAVQSVGTLALLVAIGLYLYWRSR